MSEHLLQAENAILRHLDRGQPEFIGTLVDELRRDGRIQESSLRSAVWILAGEGKVTIDDNLKATRVLSEAFSA